MTSCTPHPHPRRTRTASDLKFLLNERAVAAGTLADLDKASRALLQKLTKFESAAALLRAQLQELEASRAAEVAQLAALDAVLAHLHPRAGVGRLIRAWAGTYGRPGDRKAFILGLIREASPRTLSTTEIREAVAQRYSLTFVTSRDLNNFRTSVNKQLTRSEAAGVIVCSMGPRRVRLWAWNQGPSGAELLALTSAAGGQDEHPEPHAVGVEVGG